MISNPVTRPLARSHTGCTPDQRQGLGDIVAAGAHVRRAPGRQRHPRRIGAVLLGMALDQQCRRFPAELPGRLGRHRAGVDRIEIAAGRQHLGPAAARRAGGAGRHQTAVEPGEQPGDLGLAAARDGRAQIAARSRSSTARVRCQPASAPRLAGDETQGQRLQPLDRVAGVAPWPPAPASTARDAGRAHGSASVEQRADRSPSSRSAARARSSEASSAAAPRPGRAKATSNASSRSPSGLWPNTWSPSRICISLISHSNPSSLRNAVAASSPAAMPQSPSSPADRACSRIAAASTPTRRGSPWAAS